jgi:FkbM family methyltransferase
MTFVSYAQNCEDVMLWRALKHVTPGFYVDIGAHDPIVDSVSLAFYERGWRGVHVEPTQQYSDRLRAARPDEPVLQVAIGAAPGNATLFAFHDTGLSTCDVDIAQGHVATGRECTRVVVPVITLDALFEQFGARDIHWLKIDVEGTERSVLEGWAASPSRPWIVLVESTAPLAQTHSHEKWEALLLQKEYRFVYFDGVNRYYVSPEHAELASAFSAPPNFFDDFLPSGQSLAMTRALQAEASAAQAEARAAQAEAAAAQAEAGAAQAEVRAAQSESRAAQSEGRAAQAEARALQAETLLSVMQGTISWKLTAPLRWFRRVLRSTLKRS